MKYVSLLIVFFGLIHASICLLQVGNQNITLIFDSLENVSFIKHSSFQEYGYDFDKSNSSVILSNNSSQIYQNNTQYGEKILDVLIYNDFKMKFEFLNVASDAVELENNMTGVLGVYPSSSFWNYNDKMKLFFDRSIGFIQLFYLENLSNNMIFKIRNILPGWNFNVLGIVFKEWTIPVFQTATFNTTHEYISVPENIFHKITNTLSSFCDYNSQKDKYTCTDSFSIPSTLDFIIQGFDDEEIIIKIDQNTYTTKTGNSTELLLRKSFDNQMIFGIPFIKNFFWILDKKNNAIELTNVYQPSYELSLMFIFLIGSVLSFLVCCAFGIGNYFRRTTKTNDQYMNFSNFKKHDLEMRRY